MFYIYKNVRVFLTIILDSYPNLVNESFNGPAYIDMENTILSGSSTCLPKLTIVSIKPCPQCKISLECEQSRGSPFKFLFNLQSHTLNKFKWVATLV